MLKDRASKMKGVVWLALACFIGVLFAFGLSPLAHVIPWSFEKRVGDFLAVSQKDSPNNPKAEAILQKLVNRIYPVSPSDKNFSIDVKVVKNPEVNAYATLGGRIYVNSGLLEQAESPEELAGVLAHEITHVEHRHLMEGALVHLATYEGIRLLFNSSSSPVEWANFFAKMSFTRSQEAEADKGALMRLQKASVDNRGFRRFFERMESSEKMPGFFSDHPADSDRINMVKSFPNGHTTPIMTGEEWKILKNYGQSK
ncbi:MAG: M48 family metallopeptidase [Desulfuromonadales bacterium]|nr:M48 family metallopeptidase [Desulfuromonadales bacterium]